MTPEQFVSCIDFRYITDALTPDEALDLLRRQAPTKTHREKELLLHGFPAYTTGAGWLGYSDEQIRLHCREALANGWRHFKLKVGQNLEDNLRRASIMREEIGSENTLIFDANQIWEVDQAIIATQQLAVFDPFWIEEPTSPDDILGHATIASALAPTHVATGKHVQNRMIEYSPHLHEHFVHPVIIRGNRYMAPDAPGYSITMKPESIATFTFPSGSHWQVTASHTGKGIQRYGRVIGVKPDQIETYERLHAQVWPEVLAMIQICNIRNYSIFRHGNQLFSYFEYVGEDFAADMVKMAADPKTQAWWKFTDPLQEPLADRRAGEWWASMKEVFHTD